MKTDSITAPEADLLAFCERKISEGLETFCEVAEALLKIRDARLYRATHSTFEAYCKERWNLGRNYVNRLIQAVEVVKSLPDDLVPIVTKEGQARELAKVAPADRPAVLQEAAASGKVTARAIKEAAEKRKAEPDGDEPPRVQCGIPAANLNDEESRAHRITRAVIKACEELEAVLARMNATPRELIQAAESLRGRAKRLEFNAAKLAEDAS